VFGTGSRFKVVTIGGIPIYASFSWLIIVALFGFSRYALFSTETDPSEALTLSVVFVVLFFGGVLLHEAAHAIAARSFGLPVRAITLVFWGGATETRSWRAGPLADVVVAAAGPATTAILGVLFLFVGHQNPNTQFGSMLVELGDLNLIFAVFNAIPGFPLDGGRILMAGAWALTRNRATAQRVAGVGSMIVGGGLIAYAIVSFSNGGGFGGYGIFFGYIGFVMISVARQIPARVALRERLLRGNARDAMRPIGQAVPAGTTVYDAAERWLRPWPNRAFPVEDGGRIVGTISLDAAAHTAAARPVRDAMVPIDDGTTIHDDEPLDDVVEWIGGREALVVDTAGRTIGLIDVQDIDGWLQAHWATGSYVDTPAATLPPRPDR
jgi:Zn-dependent protease